MAGIANKSIVLKPNQVQQYLGIDYESDLYIEGVDEINPENTEKVKAVFQAFLAWKEAGARAQNEQRFLLDNGEACFERFRLKMRQEEPADEAQALRIAAVNAHLDRLAPLRTAFKAAEENKNHLSNQFGITFPNIGGTDQNLANQIQASLQAAFAPGKKIFRRD